MIGTSATDLDTGNLVSITSAGIVGIGDATPDAEGLEIAKASADTSFNLNSQSDNLLVLRNSDDGSANTGRFAGLQMKINSSSNAAEGTIRTEYTGNGNSSLILSTTAAGTGADHLSIDSSGRVIIGAGAMPLKWWNGSTYGCKFLVENNGSTAPADYVTAGVVRNTNDGEAPQLGFAKSRGTATGAVTVVQSGDPLGTMTFQGADGTNYVEAARINAIVDGTPGADDMPGRLQFSTTADGAASPTVRMTINSSGTVTIGAFTLPATDGTNGQVLQTNGSGTVTWQTASGGSGVTGSGTNTYVPRWDGTSALEDSVIVAADNGSVGFGIASPSYRIHSTSVVCCEDGAPAFRLSGTAITAKLIDLKCNIGVFQLRDVNAGAEFYNVTNTYHKWYINNNEVMQMNSSGNLLVGCTSVPDASNAGITLNGLTGGNRSSSGAPTTAYNHWVFYNGNGIVGSISTSGSATAYNTSSDYRLKENVVPLTNALDRIDEIPVYRFNFKKEPDITVDGFLADEVAPYVPESVTGTRDGMKTVVIQEGKEQRDYVAPEFWGEDDELPKDVKVGDLKIAEVQAQEYQEEITEEQPDYQQIDQSKLVPLCLKSIQELNQIVKSLRAELDELKNS